jgi:hypothetical protein
MKSVNKIQIMIGLAALSMGLMVYLADRSPDSAYLLQVIGGKSAFSGASHLFRPISGQLPAFIHVFAFALLTTGVLGCGTRGALFVCLSWLTVDVLFELGQVAENQLVQDHLGALDTVFGSGVLGNFFRFGTFDPLDLLATALGSVTAFVIWRITIPRRVLS